jgi:hypothetical protein
LAKIAVKPIFLETNSENDSSTDTIGPKRLVQGKRGSQENRLSAGGGVEEEEPAWLRGGSARDLPVPAKEVAGGCE